MSIEKSNDLIRNRTSDLPACSIVPRLTTLRAFIICILHHVIIRTVKSEGMRWARHMANTTKCIQSLFGKPDEKEPFVRIWSRE
jgi:hypothetical protein